MPLLALSLCLALTGVHARFTGPLRADGSIDYETALDARLAVPPERNSEALMAQVYGPLPAEYYRRLCVPAPADWQPFRTYDDQLQDDRTLETEQRDRLVARADRFRNRPWKPDDEPRLAHWLLDQRDNLDLVTKAAKRPHFYRPVVTKPDANGKPGRLLGTYLPVTAKTRAITAALASRAMLRLGAGEPGKAWGDILTGFRLARHVASGPSLMDYLVGCACELSCVNAALSFAEHAKLTPAELAACRRDLEALPPFPTSAYCVEVAERATAPDAIDAALSGRLDDKPLARAVRYDPTLARRKMNRFLDHFVDAAREPDRAKRLIAIADLERDMHAITFDPARLPPCLVILFTMGDREPLLTELAGNEVIQSMFPTTKILACDDRVTQSHRHLRIAFALAHFKLDRGRYPETLAELVPAYLPELPDDLFAGKPSRYRRVGDGYELSGVGDKGSRGADRVVTMPRRVAEE